MNSMEAKKRNVRPRWHHGNDYLCVRPEGKKVRESGPSKSAKAGQREATSARSPFFATEYKSCLAATPATPGRASLILFAITPPEVSLLPY